VTTAANVSELRGAWEHLEVADVSAAVTGGNLPVVLFLPFANQILLN
jgi:hypothetical protein